eukprot:2080950-Pyramimonas_sp.AAC.1
MPSSSSRDPLRPTCGSRFGGSFGRFGASSRYFASTCRPSGIIESAVVMQVILVSGWFIDILGQIASQLSVGPVSVG